MKNLFITLLIMFTLGSLNSCLDFPSVKKEEKLSLDTDFNSVKIKNLYSMAVPKYMKAVTELNEDADLQYQNIYKEAYIIVIDEPKQELIDTFRELDEWDDSKTAVENYRDIQLQFLHEGIKIKTQSEPKSLQINGLNAEIVQFDGKAEGILFDISYTLGFIEGEENMYMIMAWTLLNKKEKFMNTYDQSIRSFKLL